MTTSTMVGINSDFYPRPPGGGRHGHIALFAVHTYFYPRPPGGGRLIPVTDEISPNEFLSTPSGWRATFIHDSVDGSLTRFLSTPSGWRATLCVPISTLFALAFLSTPSGWRATTVTQQPQGISIFLSTPSGWRATGSQARLKDFSAISIHALRVEGDGCYGC